VAEVAGLRRGIGVSPGQSAGPVHRERLLAYHDGRTGTTVRAMPRADWKRARLMTPKNTGPEPVPGNQIGPGSAAQLCIIAGTGMDLIERWRRAGHRRGVTRNRPGTQQRTVTIRSQQSFRHLLLNGTQRRLGATSTWVSATRPTTQIIPV
jgi:hypothetical protein